jgi:DNA transformation protein and related proteins
MPSDYPDLIKDLARPIPGVTFKRMFGGHGVFRDGLMFAILLDEKLYFKADDSSRGRYLAEGLPPFSYARKGGAAPVSLSYMLAPERLYDEADEFCEWAREAIEVARRADAKKPARQRRAGRMEE